MVRNCEYLHVLKAELTEFGEISYMRCINKRLQARAMELKLTEMGESLKSNQFESRNQKTGFG